MIYEDEREVKYKNLRGAEMMCLSENAADSALIKFGTYYKNDLTLEEFLFRVRRAAVREGRMFAWNNYFVNKTSYPFPVVGVKELATDYFKARRDLFEASAIHIRALEGVRDTIGGIIADLRMNKVSMNLRSINSHERVVKSIVALRKSLTKAKVKKKKIVTSKIKRSERIQNKKV